MTKKEMLKKIKENEDLTYWVDRKEVIHVTVEDFEFFDADWNGVFREYDVQAVKDFIELLKATCLYYEEDLYTTYFFDSDGFAVKVGYASFDI